jgi:hypothetical protein
MNYRETAGNVGPLRRYVVRFDVVVALVRAVRENIFEKRWP